LVCNIVVSSVGTGIFSVAKALDLRSLQWFLLGSIPAAYLGGRIQLPVETLKFVLGGALIFCSAWIFLTTINLPGMRVQKTRPREILVGAGIGLLSGLVGIGGGIFLAPVLI